MRSIQILSLFDKKAEVHTFAFASAAEYILPYNNHGFQFEYE